VIVDLQERFEQYVFPEPNSGCFLWVGAWGTKGYGQFHIGGRSGAAHKAHRVAWELANGPIPVGLQVLHKCDTPCCVNPDHLFLGSNLDNHRDKARKGRGRGSFSGLPFGASPIKGSCRWRSQFRFEGKLIYLGTFATAEEASTAALAEKAKFNASTLTVALT
jgi:hypothetical protein